MVSLRIPGGHRSQAPERAVDIKTDYPDSMTFRLGIRLERGTIRVTLGN